VRPDHRCPSLKRETHRHAFPLVPRAVKVGLVSGELLVNPSPQQAALSELSLTYAGASGGRALMVEAAGDQVSGWGRSLGRRGTVEST
jgi:polyribonucleotide nucleotidyltransferase